MTQKRRRKCRICKSRKHDLEIMNVCFKCWEHVPYATRTELRRKLDYAHDQLRKAVNAVFDAARAAHHRNQPR